MMSFGCGARLADLFGSNKHSFGDFGLKSKKHKKKKKKAKLSPEEKAAKKEAKEAKRREKVERKADKIQKKNRKEIRDILVDFREPLPLTTYEKDFYDKVGEYREDIDYLSAFNDNMIHDLGVILKATFRDKNGKFISSNHEKARVILDELCPLGFKDVGLGTNIIVLRHKQYPGVVYKIALDSHGIDDNINDEWLYRRNPTMFARYICRHPSGLVSVQEAYAMVKDSDRMQEFIGQAFDMITRLERHYVIADLSPVNYKNFAVRRDGRLVIIDGSDCIPIPKGVDLLRCKRIVGMQKNGKPKICGGKLTYTADYNRLECHSCDNVYVPVELKPDFRLTEEEKLMMVNPGMYPDELDALRAYTDELIVKSGFTCPERKKKKKDKSSKDGKPKKATLDLPKGLENDPERKEKVLKQVDKLTKAFGLMNPFADDDADDDAEDEELVEDERDEEGFITLTEALPEGEPPEENFEPDRNDDLISDGRFDREEATPEVDGSTLQRFFEEDQQVAQRDHDKTEESNVTSDGTEVEVYEPDEHFGPRVAVDWDDDSSDEEEEDDPVDEYKTPAGIKELTESEAPRGEGAEENEVQVYNPSHHASLDVEFSTDPCAININVSGDLLEAFSEDGPSVFISFEDSENWIEIIQPGTFGKLIQQLLDKRQQMLHQPSTGGAVILDGDTTETKINGGINNGTVY